MNDPISTIFVEERYGIARTAEPIRVGIPLPQGLVVEAEEIVLVDADGQEIRQQSSCLARWVDATCKWVLIDAIARCPAHARRPLFVRRRQSDAPAQTSARVLVEEEPGKITVRTGKATFVHEQARSPICSQVLLGDQGQLSSSGLYLQTRAGVRRAAIVQRQQVKQSGPLRADVVTEGTIGTGPLEELCFRIRSSYFAESGYVSMDVLLHKPRAAEHPGGLWDLGDVGSVYFNDVSLYLQPEGQAAGVRWTTQGGAAWQSSDGPSTWTLFQASSGGENWSSRNHVDCDGKLTVPFRGFQVRSSSDSEVKVDGDRAMPTFEVHTDRTQLTLAVAQFWQNFPKALHWDGKACGVGLFPKEQSSPFELQGGEQKRHTLSFEVHGAGDAQSIYACHFPLAVMLDPEAVERSRALAAFVPQVSDPHAAYVEYVRHAIEGPQSFFARRDVVDEYGWRNFGDLYADHEAIGYQGPRPFVSHYNNQYDFIYGGLLQYLRSCDNRWFELARDAALHTIDIDVYHTNRDKAAFSGGMFWHTDHYKDAATCTHRTYSRVNTAGGQYGGGPSNEHNYTSGLLLYYWLTGDPEARRVVIELAQWVLRMDDGALTLLAVIDARPTGAASSTREESFHGAGRGAGNSINALLDAYVLTGEYRYLEKAEALIRRCIHPNDDVASLRLDEPESRWSYLVFLQVLGKYLDLKCEHGELGYMFHYAREALLTYATWMRDHERPYKDQLHKVEIPTETWPAQDVRKCHVFDLAASYADDRDAAALREKAAYYFERCLTDLLSFETAYLTRPMVLMIVYGAAHGAFVTSPKRNPVPRLHNYRFGEPQPFVSQKAGLRGSLRVRARLVGAEIRRLLRNKMHDLSVRVGLR